MTIFNTDTLDAIGRAIESLISLKSGVPSVDMMPDTCIALDGDNNQLGDTNEIMRPAG